jgi:hypothetical protein
LWRDFTSVKSETEVEVADVFDWATDVSLQQRVELAAKCRVAARQETHVVLSLVLDLRKIALGKPWFRTVPVKVPISPSTLLNGFVLVWIQTGGQAGTPEWINAGLSRGFIGRDYPTLKS